MIYLLIGLSVALVTLMIGRLLDLRVKREVPHPLVQSDEMASLAANRFISPRALHNLQVNRDRETPAVAVSAVQKVRRQTQTGMQVACLALLDAAATEHPAGHTKLVSRYVLRATEGDRINLMFEKSGKSRVKLWLAREHAGDLIKLGLAFDDYPASALYQPTENGDVPSYGRHQALKSMRDLANAGLIRITIDRSDQLQVILTKLAAFASPTLPTLADSRGDDLSVVAST